MFHDENLILPFKISGACLRAYGLLRLDSRVLVLEYQMMDRFVGLVRSGVRTVHLPYLAFYGAHLHKNWRGHRTLQLKTSTLQAFRSIPGALQGSCWFEIERRHREQAENFYNLLELRLSEYHLKQLSGDVAWEEPALPQKSWPKLVRWLAR